MRRSDLMAGLAAGGFKRIEGSRNLYVHGRLEEFSGCYMPQFPRWSGTSRYGGAFGIYCAAFEAKWRGGLSRSERLIDNSLPLALHYMNLPDTSDNPAFEPVASPDDIEISVRAIADYVKKLPKNASDLTRCIKNNEILGTKFYRWMNIAAYFSDTDILLQKSISFMNWMIKQDPSSQEILLTRLSTEQVEIFKRIGTQSYESEL